MVRNFVRVSYDLQLAGSRLWAGPGFRHNKKWGLFAGSERNAVGLVHLNVRRT